MEVTRVDVKIDYNVVLEDLMDDAKTLYKHKRYSLLVRIALIVVGILVVVFGDVFEDSTYVGIAICSVIGGIFAYWVGGILYYLIVDIKLKYLSYLDNVKQCKEILEYCSGLSRKCYGTLNGCPYVDEIFDNWELIRDLIENKDNCFARYSDSVMTIWCIENGNSYNIRVSDEDVLRVVEGDELIIVVTTDKVSLMCIPKVSKPTQVSIL